ncbi:Kinesin-like protein KIF19 [Trichoplax sp. H2]|nr:Kinesin-like protein KIF19 [Trichoplax sp. H2]|eukprot:RDD41252.1 Kinesin-like protein KIF19 [Trichoplax sp. H2]
MEKCILLFAQSLEVAVRLRPIKEKLNDNKKIAYVANRNIVTLDDPHDDIDPIFVGKTKRSRSKQFMYDATFDEGATQKEVFLGTTKPLIKSVLAGFNATVFAYGATGAGKTYTMVGKDDNPGIMILTLQDLFHQMEITQNEMHYRVKMSYIEIYNETIRDLLNPAAGYLELREDSKGNAVVTGITEVKTTSIRDVKKLLLKGNEERTCEPTAANKTSSRSHAVLQVTVEKEAKLRQLIQRVEVGKLFMIDLAGSERAANTQNRGKRLMEGAHINRSLLALGNCINALSENRGHYVNYRDSKLTRLLKDSLGGNCHTVMIANINPTDQHFEESRNTLVYAHRAKNIQIRAKTNKYDVAQHIAEYGQIVDDLRQEITRLETKLHDYESTDHPLIQSGDENQPDKRSNQVESRKLLEFERLKRQLVNTLNEQKTMRQEVLEIEEKLFHTVLKSREYLITIEKEDDRSFSDDSEWNHNTLIVLKKNLSDLLSDYHQKIEQKAELENHLRHNHQESNQLQHVIRKFSVQNSNHGDELQLICQMHSREVDNLKLQSENRTFAAIIRYKSLTVSKEKEFLLKLLQQQQKVLEKHGISTTSDVAISKERNKQTSEQLTLPANSSQVALFQVNVMRETKSYLDQLDLNLPSPSAKEINIRRILNDQPYQDYNQYSIGAADCFSEPIPQVDHEDLYEQDRNQCPSNIPQSKASRNYKRSRHIESSSLRNTPVPSNKEKEKSSLQVIHKKATLRRLERKLKNGRLMNSNRDVEVLYTDTNRSNYDSYKSYHDSKSHLSNQTMKPKQDHFSGSEVILADNIPNHNGTPLQQDQIEFGIAGRQNKHDVQDVSETSSDSLQDSYIIPTELMITATKIDLQAQKHKIKKF